VRAIRRDWAILLVSAILTSAGWAYLALTTENLDIEAPVRTARQVLIWSFVSANAWCWSAFMLFVGMRFLDFTNQWLVWGQEAVLPFFLLHQPVIIVIAYYVVQWNLGIFPKLVIVVIGSLLVTLSLYEFVIRRIGFLRTVFGMKATARSSAAQPREATPASSGESLSNVR
jgi:peptidoglycan/LPS O-acetylase OafA/YrhL